MSRATYSVTTEAQRRTALDAITRAPLGFSVTCKRGKRSVPQNDRMWAMLTIISKELAWHGQQLSPEDWKIVLMAGLNQEMRLVPNIEGNGLVNLGRSSSKLTKQEFTELMDLIEAFAAQHDVNLEQGKAA